MRRTKWLNLTSFFIDDDDEDEDEDGSEDTDSDGDGDGDGDGDEEDVDAVEDTVVNVELGDDSPEWVSQSNGIANILCLCLLMSDRLSM